MKLFETNSEKQIAKGLRRGENLAMREFYTLYAGFLTGICSRYIGNDDDVKDVLQDTLLNIISNIDKFEYYGKGSLKAWAARIAVNQSLSFIRNKKKLDLTGLERDFAENTGGDSYCEDDCPEINDIPPDVIHEMIRKLPDGYRTVFNLYVIDGKSHKEIASLLNIREASSASQLHRAKRFLAQRIEQYKNNKKKRL